ncbi:MAG TPA: hypothetical protein VFQ85_03105 [Mycobacteriales bacterium]|jgi:hypothetical protein|nr:hypothetical protein [Mycobacteriales bacterium]
MFQRLRAALLVPAVLVAAAVLPSPAAHASGSCGYPQGTITTYRMGTVYDYYYGSDQDWYAVDSTGVTLLGLTSTSTTGVVYLDVWDATCGTVLCSTSTAMFAGDCNVTYTGRMYVSLRASFGYYTYSPVDYFLTATTAPAAGGTDCSTTSGVQTCVTKTVGPVQQKLTLYSPRVYTAATHHAAGYVDVYRFPVAGGATATLPCVVLVANSTTQNPCADNDGTFVTRLAVLVDNTVNQPGVAVDVPLASVSVCSARYTVTVDSIGVENVPAYSIC